MNRIVLASMTALVSASAFAAPVTYVLDPAHTYPSFEADHMGGLSVWRGKFTSTSGKVVYDKAAKSGSLDVTVDMSSVDFGMPKLNEHAKSAEIFDVAKYPTATFTGKFTKFNGDAPAEAQGTLNMHGVTKPVTLDHQFLSLQTEPDEQERSVRCGCFGHLQPRRFRRQFRREVRLQDGHQAADPGGRQSGRRQSDRLIRARRETSPGRWARRAEARRAGQ